jgi:hypothetical protein
MGNQIPVPNPLEMGMEKKSLWLLNGDGDEKAFPGGEQTRYHPYAFHISIAKAGSRRIRRTRPFGKRGHHFSLFLHFIDV